MNIVFKYKMVPKYHFKNIGLAEDDFCRFCEGPQETAEHLLCYCEALSCRRLKYLGQVDFDPEETKTLAPTKLLKFIKALNIVGNRVF